MKKSVQFLKDFATKKKGDVYECDSQIASHLVNDSKVAKYVIKDEKKPIVKKEK